MASFYAELRVAGYVFRIWRCAYGTTQDTDARGRVSAKVRRGPAEFVLDVPEHSFLVDWAVDPLKRLPTEAVFFDARHRPLETLRFAAAYCMGYQEFFTSGDTDGGSYQCQLTLSDPDGWTWQLGGPSPSPQAFQQNPFVLPPTPTLPPVPVAPVQVPAPLGLLARLLALLPELGVATAVAVLLPTNSPNDPGYQSEWDFIRRNTPPTDKDRAELADLEQRHAQGTLTADEEAHLLALLARVKGLRLQQLADLQTVSPDFVGQVPMEQSDLGRMALAFRKAKSEDNWHDGNVTVFEYTDNVGKMCHLVQETNPDITRRHAERLALEKLQQQGIPHENIHRIYSELEPCETPDGGKHGDGCKAMLRKEAPGQNHIQL